MICPLKDLEPAYAHLGGNFQSRRLLDKMERGERIVTVAIGSSFIASNSGCYQVFGPLTLPTVLSQILNPHTYPFLSPFSLKTQHYFMHHAHLSCASQSSVADLTALGVDLNPRVYPLPGQRDRILELEEGRAQCSTSGGFMTAFMVGRDDPCFRIVNVGSMYGEGNRWGGTSAIRWQQHFTMISLCSSLRIP